MAGRTDAVPHETEAGATSNVASQSMSCLRFGRAPPAGMLTAR